MIDEGARADRPGDLGGHRRAHPGPLGVTVRRTARLVGPELTQRLEAAVATFASAIHDAQPGRIDHLDDELATYLTALRDAAGAARSAIDPAPRIPAAAAARSSRSPH